MPPGDGGLPHPQEPGVVHIYDPRQLLAIQSRGGGLVAEQRHLAELKASFLAAARDQTQPLPHISGRTARQLWTMLLPTGCGFSPASSIPDFENFFMKQKAEVRWGV